MSKVRIYGDTSGYVDIAVPAVAGTRTLNLDKVPQTDTSGNTGIGTDTPSQKLHVSSTDNTRVLITGGTDKYAELQFENDAQKFAMGVQNDDKFFLYNSTGTTQVLTVDTSSNVGINTQSPGSSKLKIVGSSSAYPLALDSTDTDYALEFQRNGTSEWWLKASSAGFQIHENGVGDSLTVLAGGNIGIGTTTPTQILEVKTSSSPTIEFNQADTYRGAVRLAGNDLELRNSSGVIDFFVGTDNDHDSNSTKAITIANDANTTFNGDIIANKHLRLYTTDDQANQWYVYNHTDDTLRFNYNGAGSDEAIFHTNGNIDFATNQTTSVRINSNARTNTGLNVGGASSTATGIYVDNSDGSATLDIAVLGSSYGAHGASAGEVWFYSPDNINIGGATGSSNTINFLGGGRKNIQFYNEGVVFFPEVGTRGDITFPICSISNNGSSNRYLHAQFQAQGGDMLHIHFRGYEYIGGAIKSGSGGGYIYNTGGQTTIYAQALSGNCVAVHQTTTNRVEIVVDTGTSQVGNRWGSYVFFGGTDTITANSPLSLVQYGWSSSSGRLYSS